MPHPFLIVNDDGAPLPMRSAVEVARMITKETGVHFNWHIARHAFFNRAYAAIGRIDDLAQQTVRLGDLVYWGGWTDPKSLEIYTRSARKKRATQAISTWQVSGTIWSSLK